MLGGVEAVVREIDGQSFLLMAADRSDLGEGGRLWLFEIADDGTLTRVADGRAELTITRHTSDSSYLRNLNSFDEDWLELVADDGEMYALVASDELTAYALEDLMGANDIIGSPTSDTIDALGGDDTVRASGGDDRVSGRAGDDLLFGGRGNDSVYGGSGDDTLNGQAGDDGLAGQDGDDLLNGDDGDDILIGGEGNDQILGRTGDDLIRGNTGNDLLEGHRGDDILIGGFGNDTLLGGTGIDFLDGGSGTDTFIIVPGNERTAVRDYNAGQDIFDLTAFGVTEDDLVLSTVGNDTYVDVATTTIVLRSTEISAVDLDDFVF